METLWVDFTQEDGMALAANLDDDDKEFVALPATTPFVHTTPWVLVVGSHRTGDASITSPAAIGDIDADGLPKIIVSGGNELWAMERMVPSNGPPV